MSEMVDRVARAIFHAKPSLEGEARAAVAAMREPTEAMLEAGQMFEGSDIGDLVEPDILEAWRAMIDAALE